MASIDAVDLGVHDPLIAAGAAFHLSAPVLENATLPVTDGAWVSLEAGHALAVVRLLSVPAGDTTKLLVQAHEVAQCALDIVTVSPTAQGLTMPNAHQEHLLWWKRGQRATLRYTLHVASTSSMHIGTAVLLDADGAVVPQPEPPPTAWHPCLRYFRLAEVTDDLYNAYRNMYLAFEAIVSDQVAPRQPGEKEGIWLARALDVLNQTLPLTRYVNPGVANPGKTFIMEQYKAHRCALFHAKSGEHPLLPGKLAERRQVGRALAHLAQLVLDAIHHYLG